MNSDNISDLSGSMGMIRRAHEFQSRMQLMQQTLAEMTVEGVAGAGMVKVMLTCQHAAKSIAIDPALLKEPKEVIEEVITAAYNDAKGKVDETMKSEMQRIACEMGLPDAAVA
jgi:nucleoid-associated protein EbfC